MNYLQKASVRKVLCLPLLRQLWSQRPAARARSSGPVCASDAGTSSGPTGRAGARPVRPPSVWGDRTELPLLVFLRGDIMLL